jgi:glycerol-3-phosphate cytidylyltransferase
MNIITYGTFDCLHYGHINLLKTAKSMGDFLIVGLSSDRFNEAKGKESFFNFQQRKEMLELIKPVDLLIAENSWEQKIDDIKKYKIDVFCIGNDWVGKFDYLEEFCKVVYLERTPNICSTEIKKILSF